MHNLSVDILDVRRLKMNVKELIQHLRCFDEDHHVVIQDENLYRNTEKNIAEVIFDGQNCVIKSERDD